MTGALPGIFRSMHQHLRIWKFPHRPLLDVDWIEKLQQVENKMLFDFAVQQSQILSEEQNCVLESTQ